MRRPAKILLAGAMLLAPMTPPLSGVAISQSTVVNNQVQLGDVFATQTLNVVDGPGQRIWHYLSDYMRGSGQPGWRVPVPYWVAISAVRMAFVTIFRRATKVPSILIPRRLESRLKPLKFENRKVRETLSWTPPLDYEQCLARTYGPTEPAAGTLSAGILDVSNSRLSFRNRFSKNS